MEHESFENQATAQLLNDKFVSIKVDKEERPDIDSIYMRVCQAYTGSGGWPTSIFMSPDQKPFYAGTYFPPGHFVSLLEGIHQHWQNNRAKLLKSSDDIICHIAEQATSRLDAGRNLAQDAFETFARIFDKSYGGFGQAPKFPSPHNLMFLMGFSQQYNESSALQMAEKTLLQMYKGGIFDHIGYGFSRYSTDAYWLAPHFEKMLYDNALLAVAYLMAYEYTHKPLYKDVAQKIFIYLEREMITEDGGFYSAQDADSDGVEGKYYVFTPGEITQVLGTEDGEKFCRTYDISRKGNFEGKNIPNLIKQSPPFDTLDVLLPKLYAYRKTRASLHKDSKVLTSWNALALWAYANAYRVLQDEQYLQTAIMCSQFIESNLAQGNTLFVHVTEGKRGSKGFLDDYAYYILALIALYEATFDEKYLERALALNETTVSDFFDVQAGGFYLNGKQNEQLIMRPKETYDGAMPSGNAVMAYNLDRLAKLTKNKKLYEHSQAQMQYMHQAAGQYPSGNSFFLLSALPTKDIVCVRGLDSQKDALQVRSTMSTVVRVLQEPTYDFPLVQNQTTYYVCEGNRCLPPTNAIE